MATSILARLDPSQIVHEPFPYLHSTECLEPAYYEELNAVYPTVEKVLGGRPLKNNYAYLMQTRTVIKDPEIPAIWRDFFAYHASREFFYEFLTFWRPHGVSRHRGQLWETPVGTVNGDSLSWQEGNPGESQR